MMELHIQDLVDSIKRDGIAETEKQSAALLSDARARADEIIASAKKEAEQLLDEARKDVAVLQQSGKAAVEQAGRDVLLSLKKALNGQFERLLRYEISSILEGDTLVDLVVGIVKNSDVQMSESFISINAKQFDSLASVLQKRLATELKAGLEIRPVEQVKAGFKISGKDGSWYYDFSADEIALMMSTFLNPAVVRILSDSARSA